MNPGNSIQNKILTLPELLQRVSQWRVVNKTIAFTNGCYDILHAGHIASLTEASRQGDYLVVAVNADSSIKGLKGDNRPVNDENARALVLAALSMVDAVIIFPEPTPLDLVVAIRPEVLVKGGDYKVEEIAGAREVISWGGKVVLTPIVEGYSTTSIINKLQNK